MRGLPADSTSCRRSGNRKGQKNEEAGCLKRSREDWWVGKRGWRGRRRRWGGGRGRGRGKGYIKRQKISFELSRRLILGCILGLRRSRKKSCIMIMRGG